MATPNWVWFGFEITESDWEEDMRELNAMGGFTYEDWQKTREPDKGVSTEAGVIPHLAAKVDARRVSWGLSLPTWSHSCRNSCTYCRARHANPALSANAGTFDPVRLLLIRSASSSAGFVPAQ